MAKSANEVTIVFACHDASKRRGGLETVTLVPIHGKVNDKFFRGQPQGSFNFVIDNPDGQGFFDPEKDYEVIIRERQP